LNLPKPPTPLPQKYMREPENAQSSAINSILPELTADDRVEDSL
jgi:hypothetical protein